MQQSSQRHDQLNAHCVLHKHSVICTEQVIRQSWRGCQQSVSLSSGISLMGFTERDSRLPTPQSWGGGPRRAQNGQRDAHNQTKIEHTHESQRWQSSNMIMAILHSEACPLQWRELFAPKDLWKRLAPTSLPLLAHSKLVIGTKVY